MSNPFFDHPILNSPYECPQQHWELDDDGQPTQKVEAFRDTWRDGIHSYLTYLQDRALRGADSFIAMIYERWERSSN